MSYEVQNKTSAKDESFWGLLSKSGQEFSIYIPRIQRDYAQGRLDLATTQLRDTFVNDLLNSVVHYEEGKTLDVNFIYGNIEKEDESRRFIPIDGQQRLTTLFLLHWYFAVYSGRIDSDPDVQKHLLQFKYETRNVTGKFCENLTKYVRADLRALSQREKISDVIRNYYWFFSDFENDSSIRGMLVMLDTIHDKCREFLNAGVSLDHVFELLTSDHAPIRFLYLNIDDVGLTDSIYIKMNARGKPLTHFENFKAQLRSYLSADETFANRFLQNINGIWSGFFWNPEYRKAKKDAKTGEIRRETTFDAQIMKFFRFAMLTDYIVQVDEDAVKNSQKSVRDTLSSLLREQDYIFTARLFKDSFKSVYGIQSEDKVLRPETFHRIEKLLNVMAQRQEQTGSIVFTTQDEYQKSYIDEKKAFCRLIGVSAERALTNEEQIVLFAEYSFLIKYANEDNSFDKEKELSRWLRLVSNLIKPTLNLQLDVFFNMIRTIYSIIESGQALECDLFMRRLNPNYYHKSRMNVFTDTQVYEESIKSILMNNDPAWKQVIADSENTFMEGQTGALLSFSGLEELYHNQAFQYGMTKAEIESFDDETDILKGIDTTSQYYQAFISYLNKFKMLFDIDGVRKEIEEKALFRRALLCYGGADSYMLPPNKAIRSFLDNTDRDCSFKRLLRDDNNGKRIYLKELLDDITENEPICDQLQRIIDSKEFDEKERWKQYFVKMPEILICTNKSAGCKRDPEGKYVFAVAQRFIRLLSNDDILLLTKTQTNSINRELYSYVLFLKARKNNLKVRYFEDYTDGAEKYAHYQNNQDEQIRIVYRKKPETGYVYVAKKADGTEVIYYDNMESMLDFIAKTIKP